MAVVAVRHTAYVSLPLRLGRLGSLARIRQRLDQGSASDISFLLA